MIKRSEKASWYRPEVDGLRSIAVCAVIAHHLYSGLLPSGFLGVDIFFVISGFLISRIILLGLDDQTFSFTAFYANRVRRLFPALLLVLAACLIFGWFFFLPDEYTKLGKHVVGAAAYAQNFVLSREAGYFDVGSYAKPLMHLWSLGVEEQFYLTYPLFLWLLWRFRKNLGIILLLVARVMITRHEGITGRQLVIDARVDGRPHSRVENSGDGNARRSESAAQYDGSVMDVPALGVDEIRSLLVQRPTDLGIEHLRAEIRLRGRKGIERVKERVVVVVEKLSVHLVCARLGEHLDATISQTIVLRRKRILVDAYLADR